ncbi:hypothetical protein FNV43_RR10587 [Rhamnella rubrinervis]|uniref:Patellin-3 n=1 Tax=Rhamnella rubrinervis TaxID=2594499 RepID=A0A8K0H415_9ROSA|nr:hypothetical protein FNV43_RR10587 [Rhamnella rubrinervis]
MADSTPDAVPPLAPPSSEHRAPTVIEKQEPLSPAPEETSAAVVSGSSPPGPPPTVVSVKKSEKEDPPPSAVGESELPALTTQREESVKEAEPVVTESVAPQVLEKEEPLPQPAEAAEKSEVKEKYDVSFAVDTTKSHTPQNDDDHQVQQEHKIPQNLVSFKEESNKVADLSNSERKALEELMQLVQEALDDNNLVTSTPPPAIAKQDVPAKSTEPSSKESSKTEPTIEENPVKEAEEVAKEAAKVGVSSVEVSIWGVPLLKDDRSDVILLKFLRARDFKVKDAFVMLKNTLRWRKEFGIDALLHEDLGDDLEKVVFMHGFDREGHPVCYNVFGEFQNKELYQKTFSDEEKRTKFLRWRIQFLEKSIRKLDFSPGGVCTIFQVNDLKNSPGPAKRELRVATNQALHLLQDNYPEFVAKQVFINVPWWYLAFYTMISPFLTQRTKSKFVFAGPAKSADTLFKYISPEQVPIQYGGLSVDYCDCNPEFSISDPVTEVNIKPGTKQTVEIIIYEKCVIVWELRVVGWEVRYGAEFVPNAENAYAIIIQKSTKLSPTDEPVAHNSFKVGELGKILLTVDNPTSKKKRLLYRFKIKSFSE